MTRRIHTIVLSLFMLISTGSIAQFTFDTDTAVIELEGGTEKFGYIHVTYNGLTSGNAKWRIISTDFDTANWEIQFCECSSCYTNEFNKIPDSVTCSNIPSGNEVEWKFGVDIGSGTMSAATYSIELEDLNSGSKDTLVWVTSMPNSTGDELKNVESISPIYMANGGVNLNWGGKSAIHAEVYSLTGTQVATLTLNPGVNEFSLNGAKGMFIVRAEGLNAQRIVIR